MRSFPVEMLVEPRFSERVRVVLHEARVELHVGAVAIAELCAERGKVAPAWRHVCPWLRSPEGPSLELFQQLVAAPAFRIASEAELQALGPPFDDCVAATFLVLTVTPALADHPDALFIALHERPGPLDPEVMFELKHCLEVGLSWDRRQRMAEVVFQAVEQAADPIELTDSEARLIYANQAWERTFGYVPHEVVGQTVGRLFRDPVAPIHDKAFYQFTLASIADGSPWSGALACRTRDGKRVFCEPMVSPFRAPEQGFVGNFAVRRNLAQRAERDAALAMAHHEFRTVLAAIPDGVSVLREGKIYFANAAFLHMVRKSEQSVIGTPYADLIIPEDRAQLASASEKGLSRVRMQRSDGSSRFVEISIAGAVSFEGKPAMIVLSRDVTEQRIAEEQLVRGEKLTALGTLAAGVAHEINNPLSYVALNLRFIQSAEVLSGATQAALGEALDGAQRIQQIVTELRSYSAPEAPGPAEAVDLGKAVSSAINISQNEIRHRARLERQLAPDLFALAREGPLVQVLVNVLVNAAQAIPYGGDQHTITVSSHAPSDELAVIEVRDTGVGIAPALLAHVFEPFSTTKQRGEGSGLGLAICKRIVDELGGQISMTSDRGQGSTVRIELPRANREPDTIDHALSVLDGWSPDEAPKLRVLIVDDEVNIVTTLQRVLEQYDVAIALDAKQALAMLDTAGCFDVILCDLMMPGISGPHFYDHACRLSPTLRARFVFMTGGSFSADTREFLQRHRCPVLSKPFTIADVCTAIHQVAGTLSDPLTANR